MHLWPRVTPLLRLRRVGSLCLLFAVAPVWTFPAGDTVKIESGLVAGSGTEIRAFTGMPFAAPPTSAGCVAPRQRS